MAGSFQIVQFSFQLGVMPAILAMEKRNFAKADSWADVGMEKEVKRRNTFMLFATDDGKVMGYVIFSCNSLNVHISKVAVDKSFRRRGVGQKLVQACLRQAVHQRKVQSASLHVDPANQAAVALYTKLGFRDDGKLEDYYAPGRHALKKRAENVTELLQSINEAHL